jgi:metal-responsive CopG/Arc/MetJ family transcriptional regulator
MAKRMRTVSFKLPTDLDDLLDDLARRANASRSAVVREALQAFAYSGRRSVTGAVDAVVQPVDGPTDLSTNAKHMARYGK